MDVTLAVCGATALAAGLLVAAFLPNPRPGRPAAEAPGAGPIARTPADARQ
ncbi:MAG: hypothetical protein HOY69_06590 [Streptomyces sp.]|nr:hypothetical protein [Streptomyces sp.]